MNYKKISSLDAESRLKRFKKNNDLEEFYDLINKSTKVLNTKILNKQSGPVLPPILIVSMPRTGSTLLNQLLISKLNISYVSNLMAVFYNSPIVGAKLQKSLIHNEINLVKEFKSVHGKTQEIFQPSEFGYFWSRHLSFGKPFHEPESINDITNINFLQLNEELKAISSVLKNVVLYKCSIGCFLLDYILKNTSCFVIHLSRNKTDTLKSIIKVRKERLGDERKWWSIRPNKYEQMLSKTPKEQVNWQYDKVENAIITKSKGFENRIYKCDYNNLIINPDHEIKKLLKSYEKYSKFKIQFRL